MGLTDNLISLFRLEGQVRGLRSRLEAAHRYLAAQNRLVEELEQQHRELASRKRQIQAKIGNLEGETAALDERLEKLRTELNGASTNKQYTAVLTELNKAKIDRSEREDRILEEMELVDQTNEEIEKLDGEIAERRKVRDIAARDLGKRDEEVGERLAELETEHRVAAEAIPPPELKVFNEMAVVYEGDAMAPIEEIDRRHREYACGSCNMHIPFETVAALLGSADSLVRCTACGRILYLHDETRGALSKR